MEIQSRSFNTQSIDTDTLLQFPEGIPGFEEHTQFHLLHQVGNEIIYLLQSTTDSKVAFSVAQPKHFNINYQFILTEQEKAILDIQSADDLLILLILHRDDRGDANSQPMIKGSIKSPLLINTRNKIGIQKPLNEIEQSITLTEKQNEIDVSEA